jgi:hypothetical protein
MERALVGTAAKVLSSLFTAIGDQHRHQVLGVLWQALTWPAAASQRCAHQNLAALAVSLC